MSNLQYPNLQTWKNNAAFEDSQVKLSWSSMNGTDADILDSDFSKENRKPPAVNRELVGVVKPVKSNGSVVVEENGEVKDRELSKINAEIADVEKEIKRLTSRLEGLRLEKLAQSVKIVEKRGKGKVVGSKFMEAKENIKKKGEDLLGSRMTGRRGVSLGPVEIFGSTRKVGRPDFTPVGAGNSRRNSCFWKLQDVDEVRAIKARGKSMSVSPKRKRLVSKIDGSKQAMTTVGTKKAVKKEDWTVFPIQPKRLFKDGEKPIPAKKNVKPVRKVASRYSLGGAGQGIGSSVANTGEKKFFPESDKNDGKRVDKRTAPEMETRGKEVTEGPIKKKWEIPSEIVVYKGDEGDEELSPSVAEVVDALPRIRTDRCVNETPRDSGPAKRVAELIGKKSIFSSDEETEVSVCQALDFAADVCEL